MIETTQRLPKMKPHLTIQPKDTYILIGAGRLTLPHCRRAYGNVIESLFLPEIAEHVGDLFVIDDDFSEDIDPSLDDQIFATLKNLHESGFEVGRYWGCESAPHPYRDWQGFGEEHEQLVFSDITAAAHKLGRIVRPGRIRIAGAWLGHSRETGQVNEVCHVLREEYGHTDIEAGFSAFDDPYRC